MGPAWECPPQRLANGRIVYRCMVGHFHGDPGSAWSCDGQPTHKPTNSGYCEVCGKTAPGHFTHCRESSDSREGDTPQ